MFDKESPNERYLWRLPPTPENLDELRRGYRSLYSERELREVLDKYVGEKHDIHRRFPELISGAYGPCHPQEFALQHCNSHITLIEEVLNAKARSQKPRDTPERRRAKARRQDFMSSYLKKRTLSATSTHSGVGWSSLHRWFNGKSRLGAENVAKLAEFLKVDSKQIPN